MDNNNLLLIEKRLVTRFLDMFIRFGLILALASFCFTVFSPFINMMLWALILAVALYPLHQYFAGLLAGKQGLASVVLVLLGILLIIIPTVLMITSLAESASAMIDRMGSQSFTIPHPLRELPLYRSLANGLALCGCGRPWICQIAQQLPFANWRYCQTVPQHISQHGRRADWLYYFVYRLGYYDGWGAAGAISAQRIAIRITDENKGVTLTRLCTSTIRAVARGVIGVALIRALLVGVIMLMASIPAVGIFFILALILGIAQVPVIPVTAPAIALMWSLGTHSTGMDIFYTVLLIVAGMADNVLKPLLLGRGVDAPMPVVLLGALGGMASNGILGMFLGATLLAIGYRIFMTG